MIASTRERFSEAPAGADAHEEDTFGIEESHAYLVLGFYGPVVRIINRDGEPLLHAATLFSHIGGTVPPHWVFDMRREPSEQSLAPAKEYSGLYEWVHDANGEFAAQRAAVETLEEILDDILRSASDIEIHVTRDAVGACRRFLAKVRTQNRESGGGD